MGDGVEKWLYLCLNLRVRLCVNMGIGWNKSTLFDEMPLRIEFRCLMHSCEN